MPLLAHEERVAARVEVYALRHGIHVHARGAVGLVLPQHPLDLRRGEAHIHGEVRSDVPRAVDAAVLLRPDPPLQVFDVRHAREIDLQIIASNEKTDYPETKNACVRLFDSRKLQTWPPTVVKGEHWDLLSAAQSGELDILATADEAIDWVNDLICRIN
jgi:hypothetical protein